MPKTTEWEVVVNPDTYRVNRYPWERLQEEGDVIIFKGPQVDLVKIRTSGYTYATRHNFRITVVEKQKDPREIKVIRRRWSDW